MPMPLIAAPKAKKPRKPRKPRSPKQPMLAGMGGGLPSMGDHHHHNMLSMQSVKEDDSRRLVLSFTILHLHSVKCLINETYKCPNKQMIF